MTKKYNNQLVNHKKKQLLTALILFTVALLAIISFSIIVISHSHVITSYPSASTKNILFTNTEFNQTNRTAISRIYSYSLQTKQRKVVKEFPNGTQLIDTLVSPDGTTIAYTKLVFPSQIQSNSSLAF